MWIIFPGRLVESVTSDERMQDNLYNTDYGNNGILRNKLYKSKPPMDKISMSARDITLQYVLAGFYYVKSFKIEDKNDLNCDTNVPISNYTIKQYLTEKKTH